MTLPLRPGARVLLTGATGYIGSHTWLALLAAGHQVVGVDNFANSSPRVLERVAELSGQTPVFEQADITDRAALEAVLDRHAVDAAVHFAALKSVGDSVRQPFEYFRVNLGGLMTVAQALQGRGVHRLVFSSSATVYAASEVMPLREDAALTATAPYGWTKLHGEQWLGQIAVAEPRWAIATLRYFNPVGAHASGRLGEDPRGTPANLMPYLAQVAVGRRASLQIYGSDYPTPDGTGMRDYLHVMDLAEGHVAALQRLLDQPQSFTVNLGTGRGHSVLEVLRAFEAACGRPLPHAYAPRRAGDLAAYWADPSLAATLLGWRGRRSLAEMCADSWRWQSSHPEGLDGPGS